MRGFPGLQSLWPALYSVTMGHTTLRIWFGQSLSSLYKGQATRLMQNAHGGTPTQWVQAYRYSVLTVLSAHRVCVLTVLWNSSLPYAFEYGRQDVSVSICSVSVIISSQYVLIPQYSNRLSQINSVHIWHCYLLMRVMKICINCIILCGQYQRCHPCRCDTPEIFVAPGSCA